MIQQEANNNLLTVLKLSSFEPAFAVGPNQSKVLRRFSTLLVQKPSSKLRGGMCYVCRATTTDGMPLAVKRLLPYSQTSQIDRAEYFDAGRLAIFQEYRSLLAVAGKNGFPRVYGYGEAEGEPLILMEWVEGSTLRSVMSKLPHDSATQRPGVRSDVVCVIGESILRILLEAGSGGSPIVHRDISSRNVMFRTTNSSLANQVARLAFDIVLIDFGSATFSASQNGSLTVSSGIVRYGTPAYAPPEMLTADVPIPESARTSPLVDVYALCSVLYELYSGKLPFSASAKPGESFYLRKTTSVPAPLVPHRESDRGLCEAILGGIRVRQEDRPRPQELLAQLDQWRRECAPTALARSLPLYAVTSDPASQPREPQKTRNMTRRALVAGICTVGALGAVALARAWRKASSGEPYALFGNSVSEGAQSEGDASSAQDDGLAGADQSADFSSQKGASASEVSNTEPDIPFAWPAQDSSTMLWGLIGTDGAWLVQPTFATQPGSWSANGTPGLDGASGKWGFFGTDGSWTVNPTFKALGPLSTDGYAAARDTLGGWGIVDSSGSWVVRPSYVNMGLLVNQGVVRATQSSSNTTWGMLKVNGTWAIAPNDYTSLGACGNNGLVAACVSSYLWGYLRVSNSSWAIKPSLAEAMEFSDDLAACRANDSDATWVYIDASGNRILEGYAAARPFQSGFAAAKDAQSGLWGIVDKQGNWAASPTFTQLGDVHNGLAAAQDASSGLWGLIDTTGAWSVGPTFASIVPGRLETDQPSM